jgi:hypothetical protein
LAELGNTTCVCACVRVGCSVTCDSSRATEHWNTTECLRLKNYIVIFTKHFVIRPHRPVLNCYTPTQTCASLLYAHTDLCLIVIRPHRPVVHCYTPTQTCASLLYAHTDLCFIVIRSHRPVLHCYTPTQTCASLLYANTDLCFIVIRPHRPVLHCYTPTQTCASLLYAHTDPCFTVLRKLFQIYSTTCVMSSKTMEYCFWV